MELVTALWGLPDNKIVVFSTFFNNIEILQDISLLASGGNQELCVEADQIAQH